MSEFKRAVSNYHRAQCDLKWTEAVCDMMNMFGSCPFTVHTTDVELLEHLVTTIWK